MDKSRSEMPATDSRVMTKELSTRSIAQIRPSLRARGKVAPLFSSLNIYKYITRRKTTVFEQKSYIVNHQQCCEIVVRIGHFLFKDTLMPKRILFTLCWRVSTMKYSSTEDRGQSTKSSCNLSNLTLTGSSPDIDKTYSYSLSSID